jgi:hypothetical protein
MLKINVKKMEIKWSWSKNKSIIKNDFLKWNCNFN